MINTTCAVDLAELEGDEATGADVCQEYKVVAPLTKSRRMGKGSVLHGGTVADVGHLYAFGNTEERYRIKILGCKGKGTLGVDRPFNHATKVGSCVKERTGDYDDALRNKKALVIPMILEAFGGISPHSLYMSSGASRDGRRGRARATAPFMELRARAPSRSSHTTRSRSQRPRRWATRRGSGRRSQR